MFRGIVRAIFTTSHHHKVTIARPYLTGQGRIRGLSCSHRYCPICRYCLPACGVTHPTVVVWDVGQRLWGASPAGHVHVAPSFASTAAIVDEGRACGWSVRPWRLAGLDTCEFASLQPRRAKAWIWNVRTVSPPPSRSLVRVHYLPRMVWVSGWMCQASVDDRLAQLLGVYNMEKAFSDGLRLQYDQLRTPVSGKFVCTSVHSESEDGRAPLYRCLRHRLSWTDNAAASIDDVQFFVTFLKGTLSGRLRGVGTLQNLAVYMLLMQITSRKLVVRGVELLLLAVRCVLPHSPPSSRLI